MTYSQRAGLILMLSWQEAKIGNLRTVPMSLCKCKKVVNSVAHESYAAVPPHCLQT